MSVKDALGGFGWLVALVVGLSSFVGGAVVEHEAQPVQDVEDFIAPSSATIRCLDGWTETTGTEPDSAGKFKVCTSPDKRLTITARENQPPVGYDGVEGRFLTAEETAGLLR